MNSYRRASLGIVAVFLVVIDVSCKFLIQRFLLGDSERWIPVLGPVYLHPVFNLEGNWLNSTFYLGYNHVAFCLFCFFGFLFAFSLLLYMEFRRSCLTLAPWVMFFPYLFAITILSRLVVALSGQFVLDYIGVHVGTWAITFDLADLYLCTSILGILITLIWMERKEKPHAIVKKTIGEKLFWSKQEKIEFVDFIKTGLNSIRTPKPEPPKKTESK